MSSRHRFRPLTPLALLGLAFPFLFAGAYHPVAHDGSRPAEIDRPQARPSFVKDAVRYEAATAVPRALYQPRHPVAAAAPEAQARQFLAESAKLLRLEDPTLADLTHTFTREGKATTTVRFRQTHQGLPVLGSDMSVSIDGNDTVVYASNGYETKIDLPTIIPSVAQADARRTALDYLGITGPLNYDVTRLAVKPDAENSKLVYEARFVPMTQPHGDWIVLIDAQSGSVIRAWDTAHYVDGSGLTWDPDPLSSSGQPYNAAGPYGDLSDATNAALDAERVSVTLKDITDLGGGQFSLVGPYAQIVDVESPFNGLFPNAGSTFNYNRFDDNFEAVLCYYHIDNIMRYINETLGVAVSPTQYAGGAKFDPSGFSGQDNSRYSSATGDVSFGEGGVDDAEDADVVIHELGHALHDWLTGGNLSQVDGLSEGCGDYIAQSYSRSLGQWTTSDPEYHWVFNWDGHNEFWAGRITNHTPGYPGGLVNQIHTDGQIWATANMLIWDQLGRDATDTAFYEGLAMTNGSSSQNDAAQAVLNAASALGYSSSDLSTIFNIYTNTGYSITSPAVALAGQVPVLTAAGGNGAADPGETVTFKMDVTNVGAVGATLVSAVLTSGTPGVVINQGASAYPDLGPGVTGTNLTDYSITLPVSHVCGDPVDLSLAVSFTDSGPNSANVSNQMGTGVPVGANQSVSPGIAIPDNTPAGISSNMVISGTGGTVTANLNIDLDITHTYQGDLIVTLTSPASTSVVLHNRTGGSADNIIGNYPGTLTPANPLSAFIGDPLDGTWTMSVSDNAGIDTGTLNSWGINDISGYNCDAAATDVQVVNGAPDRFALSAASPNPFGPSTAIAYAVPGDGAEVSLEVFDVSGRLVRTLVRGFQPAGQHTADWNGLNERGDRVGSGIYFYRLQSENFDRTRKVVLVK